MIYRLNIPLHSSGIYIIFSNIDNKFYIGSAINLRRRKSEHFSHFLKNNHNNCFLQRHYNKYGIDSLWFGVIEFCSKKKLIEREQYYMDTLKPEFNLNPIAKSCLGIKRTIKFKLHCKEIAFQLMKDPKRKLNLKEKATTQFSNPEQRLNLSNKAKIRMAITGGPMKGKHHTEESNQKNRKSHIGMCDGEKNPMFGKKHSFESLCKQSQTFFNKPLLTCPYCKIQNNNHGNMYRWHFNNCKHKITRG